MSITATELKNNLGHYLTIALNEDIYITQYGKTIAVLTSPKKKGVERLGLLQGFLEGATQNNIDSAKWEELSKKCGL